MHILCTYFDHRYLPRALALFDSLRQHGSNLEIWPLAFTPECEKILRDLNLPGVRVVGLGEFLAAFPALAQMQSKRQFLEFYFTCTPFLPEFVLQHRPEATLVSYLDADLYFFDSPDLIEKEIGDAPVSIIAHRFPPALEHLARFGIYNVGWLSFKNNPPAMACLRWWQDQCLGNSSTSKDTTVFGDQKYLDDWPERFPGTKVLTQKGMNLAPWNVAGYTLSLRDGKVFVDEDPLVFHHFHGLRRIEGNIFNPRLVEYGSFLAGTLRTHIYQPYMAAWIKAEDSIQTRLSAPAAEPALPLRKTIKRWFRNRLELLKGNYFRFKDGEVL